MALLYTKNEDLGREAAAFSLPATDGKTYSLHSFSESKVLVVIFMCNHCPYVIAVQDRINDLAKAYAKKGVALIGINPNDASTHPADSFEAMKVRVQERGFVFPYLRDESQEVARAYNAVCTPDPYVFENLGGGRFVLRYHGRIDDSWKDANQVHQRDLADALDAILSGKPVSLNQLPSMGCSIKWKK